MAASTVLNDGYSTNIDNKHLEIFSLIWLDAHANPKETRDTEQRLRSVINHLKKFKDVQQCQQYIEQKSEKDRLILIVSGRFGREIVPNIHNLRQVISIYVYCMDKKSNKEWSSKFKKVKGVVVDLDHLISRITNHHKIQKKIEEPLSITIFTTTDGTDKSTTEMNGQFVFSQILIDCLLRLKSTEIDNNELMDCCKDEYEGNSVEWNNLCKFEQDYSSDKVLWWYTRESFFYKTLDAALCAQNIHMIFLYRSLISDMYQQLEKYQSKTPVRVYRSQMMSTNELKTLQQSLGQFVSINSFFSTNTDYWKTLSYFDISDGLDDLERVLFKIDADPKMVTTKPFAHISEHSEFPDETEILFMIGSIFRLKSINRNDDQIWIIHMTLCNDDEYELRQIFMFIKQQVGDGKTNLRTFGKILCNMGKFDLAAKYFNRLLNELSPNDPLRATLDKDLVELASQKGDCHMSVQWHQQLLEFQSQNPNNSTRQAVASTHININTKWKQNAVTIAGGNGDGNQLNQLSSPCGIHVDDDNQCIYIADWGNHRILEWKLGANNGQVVAGGKEKGNRMDQLDKPTDVIVDKNNDYLIICDWGNRRVVRWSRQNRINGQTIISDIHCFGLTMDNNGDFYVSDWKKNEVTRCKTGDTNRTIVAGGNGQGNHLNQLNCPTSIFVDDDYSIYVSDCDNNRVIKWLKGAKQGIIVAGGQGQGDNLTQLSSPQGVIVDQSGTVYIAESEYDQIMRWSSGSKEGSSVVGGNGQGKQANQLNGARGISFDGEGNLYVVDYYNHRVQKFDVDKK